MGGGLTKAAIAMVDDDPALTAVIREALPQTVALLQRKWYAPAKVDPVHFSFLLCVKLFIGPLYVDPLLLQRVHHAELRLEGHTP